MKKIIIQGDSTIKKVLPEQYDGTRKEIKKLELDEHMFTHSKQIELVNSLYLNIETKNNKITQKNINKKLNSYKQQDIRNEIYGKNFFISLDQTLQKLVESKMKCVYCNSNIFLIYKNIREDYQWTLDRIDNNMGHNTENVVISCLKCNLERRNQNMNKFMFTKKLNIKKVN